MANTGIDETVLFKLENYFVAKNCNFCVLQTVFTSILEIKIPLKKLSPNCILGVMACILPYL